MPPKTTTFKMHGPLFDKDASKNLVEATNRGLLDLVTIEGSARILGDERKPYQLWGPPLSQYNKSAPSERHGRKIGELRRHIGAAVIRDSVAIVAAGEQQEGRQNLIYAAWVEGISPRNASSSFKGYGMFKNTREHMDNPTLHEEYIGAAIAEAFDA